MPPRSRGKATTALMLQAAEDYSTLVLCPKNLEPMWERYIDEYDLSLIHI